VLRRRKNHQPTRGSSSGSASQSKASGSGSGSSWRDRAARRSEPLGVLAGLEGCRVVHEAAGAVAGSVGADDGPPIAGSTVGAEAATASAIMRSKCEAASRSGAVSAPRHSASRRARPRSSAARNSGYASAHRLSVRLVMPNSAAISGCVRPEAASSRASGPKPEGRPPLAISVAASRVRAYARACFGGEIMYRHIVHDFALSGSRNAASTSSSLETPPDDGAVPPGLALPALGPAGGSEAPRYRRTFAG
jgi:hypothetical protein